jgi:hypothetical protein
LAAAVLVSALFFGAIRALVSRSDGPVVGGLAILILASVAVAISSTLILAGRKLAGWATARLKDWGVRIGGVFGFLAWLLGLGVEVAFVLASILVGPIAAVSLLFRLLASLG